MTVSNPGAGQQQAGAELRPYVVPIRSVASSEALVMATSARDAMRRFVAGESHTLHGKEFGPEEYGRVRRATDADRRWFGPLPATPSVQPDPGAGQQQPDECVCTDLCPASDNPCPWCCALDVYDPCPVIGFGCGSAGIVKPGDPEHDCCTDEQLLAAAGNAAS